MENTWINDRDMRILEALATYKYLVPYQLLTLGIAGHAKTIQRHLKLLREESPRRRLVQFKQWGWEQGVGNRHTCYALSERGAAVLADYFEVDPARIEYPRGKMVFERDYFHRLNTIDTQIAIRLWAKSSGARIESMHSYLNSVGANRTGRQSAGERLHNKTRTALSDGFFVPDGVCLFEHGGKRRLAAIEIHNRNKTYRVLDQLQRHISALAEGALSKAYGHDKANFVLSVFEDEGTMRATIRMLRQTSDFMNFLPLFHFAPIARVREDVRTAWIDGNGVPVAGLFA